MTNHELTIDWTQATLMMTSFGCATLGGWIGWMNRPKPRSLVSSVAAAANCGVVGILACEASLLRFPDAYHQAFFVSLLAGWTTGRYGIRKIPEVLGLLTRLSSGFRAFVSEISKSDSER